MELSVREDPTLDDVHVRIDCPRIDGRVRRIVEAAEMEDRKLAGVADGYLCMVGVGEVLYAETVDGRCRWPSWRRGSKARSSCAPRASCW